MTQEPLAGPTDDETEPDPIGLGQEAPSGIEKGSFSKTVTLDGEQYALSRLRTRDGLSVAKTILEYATKLQPLIEQGVALQGKVDTDDQTAIITAGLGFAEQIAAVIDEDELVTLASKILGIHPEIVANAPAEDTLNAIADAFEVNNMPALLNAAQRIWNNLQRFTGN